jgi:NADP-dependent 3-hydroxy acid dehydrogenase YdfG
MELANRTALITGATAGIGLACAELLHEAGMRLVLAGRRAERIAELEARWPGTVGLAGDIADPAMPARLLELALEHTGRCDVLLNNAGVNAAAEIDALDIEAACTMVRVNVEAAYRMAYTALKHFKRTGEGYLIHTSSVLGTKVRRGTAAYSGTKYALEGLTEGLRLELVGSNIHVACVQPAFTDTELHRDRPVDPGKRMGITRPLQPMDVARCVLFMLQQPPHVRVPKLLLISADQDI